jgi:hypothetical protein
MKGEGEAVTLTVNHWDGEGPEEGDFLRTGSGRCYRIDEVLGRRLRCTVLAHEAVEFGAPGVWWWEWSARPRAR